MKPTLLSCLAFLGFGIAAFPSGVSGQSPADQSGYRTFTANDGRKIEARILYADFENVWFERSDGLEFKLPVNQFTPADRQAFHQWRSQNRLAKPPQPKLFTLSYLVKKAPESQDQQIAQLRLTNTGTTPYSDLRVSYTVYIENETTRNQPTSKEGRTIMPTTRSPRSPLERVTGEVPLSAVAESALFDTKPFGLETEIKRALVMDENRVQVINQDGTQTDLVSRKDRVARVGKTTKSIAGIGVIAHDATGKQIWEGGKYRPGFEPISVKEERWQKAVERRKIIDRSLKKNSQK